MATVVYFGTNRRPIPKEQTRTFSGEFSTDGLANLRFGSASVELDARPPAIALDVYPEVGPNARVKPDFLGDVQRRMIENQSDVLVYIHGFNVTFDAAIFSAAQLQVEYSRLTKSPIQVVVFSWPSDGKALHYANDREDAKASGHALNRGLEFLFRFLAQLAEEDACDRRLHLLCHSMGNYALRWAVQSLKQERRLLPRVFDEIILAAADEDDDAFEHEHKLADLPRLGNRVSVYHNVFDRALGISDQTKGNPDRLGASGARLRNVLHQKISLVDCTPVVEGLVEHSYYLNEPRVVRDICSVLDGLPSDAIPGRTYQPEKNAFQLRK